MADAIAPAADAAPIAPAAPAVTAAPVAAPQALETSTALPANLPAADSPAAPVEAAPITETAPKVEAPAEPKSLLGELLAKPEPEKVEPPKVEPEAPAEPLVVEPIKYEAFKLPEGVQLAEPDLAKYTEILGKHQVPQEATQALVDLYVAERTREVEAQRANWENTTKGWLDQFRADPDIGKNRSETTIANANAVLTRYGQVMGSEREAGLRQAFNITGIGNHPDMIRFVNWMAGFTTEQAKPVVANVRTAPLPQGKAQRRYANSLGNGAS